MVKKKKKKRKRKRNKKKAKKKLQKNIKKKLQNELANKKSSTKESVAEKKMHDIAKEAKEIMEGEQNINEIDAKINRIKNLYEKHMKLQK